MFAFQKESSPPADNLSDHLDSDIGTQKVTDR